MARKFREELAILLRVARSPGILGSVFGELPDNTAVELAVPFLEKLDGDFADAVDLEADNYGDISMRWVVGDSSLSVGVTTDEQYVTQTENADGFSVSGVSTEMDAALKAVDSFIEEQERRDGGKNGN